MLCVQSGDVSHLVWVGTLSISCGVDSTCAAIWICRVRQRVRVIP